MHLLDYTHPDKVPALHLPNDRRSPDFYLRLDELKAGHPFQSPVWALFRYPDWLEGGSAWMQARAIADDIRTYVVSAGLTGDISPVVGSGDFAFDEALAQALRTLGFNARVAEVLPRRSHALKT